MTELREKLNNIVEEKNTKVLPENLKAGVEAFGVQGNFTSDATATAADIALGKTAYVNGEKIVGTTEMSGEPGISLITGNDAAALFYYGTRYKEKEKWLSICKELTSLRYMFSYINDIYNDTTIDLTLLPDTSKVTTMSSLCTGNTKITNIDLSVLNTSSLEDCGYMFSGCTNLVTVNLKGWDIPKVTRMKNMFYNCPLSKASINQVLAMCITATSMETKTLAELGFLITQISTSTIQSCSNYQAFYTAGWRIGY